jgi:tyrosyl-tRNA synthetase
MTTDFLADLDSRGLLYQTTSPDVAEALRAAPTTGYAGFDPTAKSLHVGSLLPLLGLVRFRRAGHRPIAVVGGGTGLIGDPSGKSAERSMLSLDVLRENTEALRRQIGRFLDLDDGGSLLLDNSEWLSAVGLLEFLRDVGKHFSVNQMIHRDSVRRRLEDREQGISYTEFSYALLQAYDFLVLHDRYGCTLQIGGSDQWGNITDGADLVRRLRGKTAYGVTMPLVVKADGGKFGKSEQGNVWLDGTLTRPFDFRQFWLNVDDADAIRYLRYFTFLSTDEIAAIEQEFRAAPEKRAAQKRLADEATTIVHGAHATAACRRATAVLFEGADPRALPEGELREAFAGAPRLTLPVSVLGGEEAKLTALLAATGLAPSKGQARTAVESGAVSINQIPTRDVLRAIVRDDLLPGGFVVLRRGKKTYHVVAFE